MSNINVLDCYLQGTPTWKGNTGLPQLNQSRLTMALHSCYISSMSDKLDKTAAALAKVMVEHLSELSDKERQVRIADGEKVMQGRTQNGVFIASPA
jgi:hypothetical protein